jgi:alkanesulfonate monooxygenase SsuD/methylene tetrahydromethanopterin reductase-like flavin-dependent oxidoreductase (luciferase family)
MLIPVHIDEPERAHARAASAWAALTGSKVAPPDRLFAAGDPDAVVEQLHRYHELGCTEFMLAPADQGGGYLRQVDALSEEVLPRIRAFS